MKPHLRIPAALFNEVLCDLKRTHVFAAERVGFLFARPDSTMGKVSLLLAAEYWPVPDDGYVNDPLVGAKIDEATIREAMQRAFNAGNSAFHVHEHDWYGKPTFSLTDEQESSRLMPCFASVVPRVPHGALIFGRDSICGKMWVQSVSHKSKCITIPRITIVGFPMKGFSL